MSRDTIWDPVRKKSIQLTPEEGVRQWLIKELTTNYNYPLQLLSCEYSFKINENLYRSDIVLFDSELKPLMLIECKAPHIKLNKEVFQQAIRYNMALKAPYLMVSNGDENYLAKIELESGNYNFLSEIPKYEELSR